MGTLPIDNLSVKAFLNDIKVRKVTRIHFINRQTQKRFEICHIPPPFEDEMFNISNGAHPQSFKVQKSQISFH